MPTKHIVDPTIQSPLFTEGGEGYYVPTFPVQETPSARNLSLIERKNGDLVMAVNGEMRPIGIDNLAFLYDSLCSMSERNSNDFYSERTAHDTHFASRLEVRRPIRDRRGETIGAGYRAHRAEATAYELDIEAKKSFLKGIGSLAMDADFQTTVRVMENSEASITYQEFDHYYGKTNELSRPTLQKKIIKQYQRLAKAQGRKINQARAKQEMRGIAMAAAIMQRLETPEAA